MSNIDATDSEPPWADYEVTWDARTMRSLSADMHGVDQDTMIDRLKRSKWLEDQDLATVIDHEAPEGVYLDDDTLYEHNRYLWTGLNCRPDDIMFEEGMDDLVDWLIDIKGSIDRHTDWAVTNKRLLTNEDGQDELVLTLAPESTLGD